MAAKPVLALVVLCGLGLPARAATRLSRLCRRLPAARNWILRRRIRGAALFAWGFAAAPSVLSGIILSASERAAIAQNHPK